MKIENYETWAAYRELQELKGIKYEEYEHSLKLPLHVLDLWETKYLGAKVVRELKQEKLNQKRLAKKHEEIERVKTFRRNTKQFNMWLNHEDYAVFTLFALQQNLSLSEFFRMCAKNYVKRNTFDDLV